MPNRHQPKKSLSVSVAWGWGMRACLKRPTTGDHKGPPPIHPTALAPTKSSIGILVEAYWATQSDARFYHTKRTVEKDEKSA